MDRATARRQLLEIYAGALRAVAGDELVRKRLLAEPINAPCHVVAIGKAAEAMALGARQALGTRLQRGLLITRHGYLSRSFDAPWSCIEAGHPLPDGDSLKAGARLLEFLQTMPAGAHLLFLISGGTSSLVEVLPDGVSADTLHQANQWLLASGLDIASMNRVRKRLSAIKAGRLAAHVRGHDTTQLLLSDVPGNDPHVIGSGLLVQHHPADIDTGYLSLPEWLDEALRKSPPLESISDSPITTHLLATNQTLRLAARHEAERRGFSVVSNDFDFQGDAQLLGHEFARAILSSPPALHVWGGEATVKLPPHPGRGGRCQQLALSAAVNVAGSDDGLLLAAGSDGSDGPGEDAGALVDGSTVGRGELEGLDAHQALHAADAGRFLEASGDLIQTGPTGSNVMDLVLGLKL